MSPKTIVLFSLAMVQFFAGWLAQYNRHRESPSFTIALVLLCSALIFAWYRFDSDQLKYQRSILLNAGVAAFAIVALPYYFFRSRGFKQGAVATLLFLVALVAYSLISVSGQYAAYYALQS